MPRTISTLEQSELRCRRQDAALLRRAVANFWRAFRAGHNPNADAMERAKLACQMRDAEGIRQGVAAITHAAAKPGLGGAARA